MKITLTVDGKPVDPSSPYLSARVSAEELNEAVEQVVRDLKHKESQAANNEIRKIKNKLDPHK